MKKLCNCKKVLIDITEKRCSECEKKYKSFLNENKKVSENEKFYKTNKWKKLSNFVRDKYKGLDLYELKINNKIVKSKVVHHIIPIKDDPTKKWDLENLIPVSLKTHRFLENLYNTEKKEKIQKNLLELVKRGI